MDWYEQLDANADAHRQMQKERELKEKENNSLVSCDKCKTEILKGDVRHCEEGDLCEYCYDIYLDN